MSTPQALQDFLDALAELHEQHGLAWDESLYKPAEGWELDSMEDAASRIPLVINVETGSLQHAQDVAKPPAPPRSLFLNCLVNLPQSIRRF